MERRRCGALLGCGLLLSWLAGCGEEAPTSFTTGRVEQAQKKASDDDGVACGKGDEGCAVAAPGVLSSELDFVSGELLVKFDARTGEALSRLVAEGRSPLSHRFEGELQAWLKGWAVEAMEPLCGRAECGDAAVEGLAARASRAGRSPRRGAGRRLDHIFRLRLGPGQDVLRARVELEALAEVSYAEPNWRAELATPIDTFLSNGSLWAYDRMAASDAWGYSSPMTGSGVVVAVLDSGVDFSHPDLAPNLLSSGWDFVGGDPIPEDLHGHGTMTTGIVAGASDATGTVGLAYEAQILPIRVLDGLGNGDLVSIAQGINYALGHPADVINLSVRSKAWSQALEDFVVTAHGLDIVVVAAAGNDEGRSTCHYAPSNVEAALSVGGVDFMDARPAFANQGVKLDVGAYTGLGCLTGLQDGILTTWPMGGGAGACAVWMDGGRSYAVMGGTSAAAPQVAAQAALLRQLDPSLSNEEIRQLIRRTAEGDVGPLPGFDPETGYGRPDLRAMVTLLDDPAQWPPPVAMLDEPRNCATIDQPVPLSGLGDGAGGGAWALEVGAGRAPLTWTPVANGALPVGANFASFDPQALGLSPGVYTLRLRVSDSNGLRSEDRNEVKVCPPCAPLPWGALAWWKLDERSGSQAAEEIAGSDGQHQLSSPHPAGALDYAASFHVGGAHIQAPDVAPGHDHKSLTVELWAMRYQGGGTLLSYSDQLNERWRFWVDTYGFLRFDTCATGVCESFSSTFNTLYQPDEWVRVGVVLDGVGQTVTFIVNGQLDYNVWSMGGYTGSLPQGPSPEWTLGARRGGVDAFLGRLDDVRVYRRALTLAELLSLNQADCGGVCDVSCPDPLDPNVTYASQDPVFCDLYSPAVACEAAMGGQNFDNHCGCGCVFTPGGGTN